MRRSTDSFLNLLSSLCWVKWKHVLLIQTHTNQLYDAHRYPSGAVVFCMDTLLSYYGACVTRFRNQPSRHFGDGAHCLGSCFIRVATCDGGSKTHPHQIRLWIVHQENSIARYPVSQSSEKQMVLWSRNQSVVLALHVDLQCCWSGRSRTTDERWQDL